MLDIKGKTVVVTGASKGIGASVVRVFAEAGAIGMSPGTVATQMQRDIKASCVNQVSQMYRSDHIPTDWPALALLWMCGSDANEFLGQKISLKEEVRQRIGITS